MGLPAKRIIITRPQAQAQAWAQSLGQTPDTIALPGVVIPALSIQPVQQPAQIAALKSPILALDQYRFLIFVSQNAVHHGFDWIEAFWPQFPQGPYCLSIGSKTQAAINQRLQRLTGHCEDGHPVHRHPAAPMTSESLLSQPALQQVAGEKVLIFRGVGGRTRLREHLQARSAIVDECPLYQRVAPANLHRDITAAEVNPCGDILTVFSGETLINFHRALQIAAIANWETMPVLVPSERVKGMATDLGYRHVTCAANATDEQMRQALARLLANQQRASKPL